MLFPECHHQKQGCTSCQCKNNGAISSFRRAAHIFGTTAGIRRIRVFLNRSCSCIAVCSGSGLCTAVLQGISFDISCSSCGSCCAFFVCVSFHGNRGVCCAGRRMQTVIFSGIPRICSSCFGSCRSCCCHGCGRSGKCTSAQICVDHDDPSIFPRRCGFQFTVAFCIRLVLQKLQFSIII